MPSARNSTSKSKSPPATPPTRSIECFAERKGGKFTIDVALISSRENQQRLVPSESLVPFTPLLIHPEVIDMSKWYKGRHMYADKFGKFTLIYHAGLEDQYEAWYNTDKIKEAEIATLAKQTDVFRSASGKARSPAKAWAIRPASGR